MDNYREKVIELMYAAMRELNSSRDAGRKLDMSPGTILIGQSSGLDSLAFVNLMATIEENIERALHRTLSVMDIVLEAGGLDWTVADVADQIARRLDDAEHGDTATTAAAG